MEKYKPDSAYSYTLGMSLTIEALLHRGDSVKEILLSSKASRNAQLEELLELCRRHDVSWHYDDRTIDRLSIKENCYCIGSFVKYEGSLRSDRHVVLYGFSDYGELGTVLRSAVAFDFHDIVLIDCDLDYFDPRCIRASMGSIFQCNMVRFESVEEYKKKYGQYRLYPFVSVSKQELSDTVFEEPYGLLIAQDYYGLDEEYPDGISLDHRGEKEISLSVRSSIILENAYAQKRSR